MPPRTAPIPRSAFRPPVASRPVIAAVELGPRTAPPRTRRDTGFSAAVKLAVRTRAGDGDPEQALAECCGIWLGRYGGEIQHIIARGSGGTSRPGISSIRNAALMCRPDHALAENRDPELYERGFWRCNAEEVGAAPLMLHGRDGGFTRWLTEDGGYGTTPPEGNDAA